MTKKLEDFVALIREYQALVDNAASRTAHAFLSSCASLLPRLYAAAFELPDVEPNTEELDESVESPMRKLGALLGRIDLYWEVFDPCVEEKESLVCGLLSDDLADIYLDLVSPLAAFEAGRVNDAVWAWKFNLRAHYGAHIVSAMRAIHQLVLDHMPRDYVAGEDEPEPMG